MRGQNLRFRSEVHGAQWLEPDAVTPSAAGHRRAWPATALVISELPLLLSRNPSDALYWQDGTA